MNVTPTGSAVELESTPPRRRFGRFATNTLSNIVVRITEAVSGFLISVILARHLSPTETGLFFYILSLVNILMTLVDLGTAQIGVREAVWERERGPFIFGTMLSLRLCLAAAVVPIAGVVGLALKLSPDEFLCYALCVLAWMVVDQAVLGTARAALLAYEKLYWDAVIACIGIAMRLVGLLVAVYLDWQLPGIFLTLLVGSIARAILAMVLVGAVCLPIRMSFDLAYMRILLRKSVPLGIILCVLAVRGNLNSVLTKWMAGTESTGYFGLAQKICSVVTMLAGAALTALYPRICGAGAGSRHAMRKGVNFLLKWGVLLYFPVFLVLSLPSAEIVHLLFGPKFAPAGATLALMAIFPMMSVIDMLYGMTFIALARIWTYLIIMVIATVVNLGASLLLIPRLDHGGAALAAVVSSGVMVALGAHQLARALEGPVLWNVIVWPGVCFVVAAGCAMVISQPLVATGVSLAVYGICAVLLRRRLGADRSALQALSFRERARA